MEPNNITTALAALAPSERQLQVARATNEIVRQCVTSTAIGFEKAFLQASAIQALDLILTDEFYAPILKLKGTVLGFLTDENKKSGYEPYKDEIVKECIKAAVLRGLNVTGNEFNILAAKPYTTKEGYTGLLLRMGVKFDVTSNVPIRSADGSATVEWLIEWDWDGQKYQKSKKIKFVVKVNSGMSDDALIGKSERKAKKWLYEEITKTTLPDGEIDQHSTVDGGYATVIDDKLDKNDVAEETPISMPESEGEPQDETYQKRKKDAILFMKKAKNIQELNTNRNKAIEILSKFEGFKPEYLNEADDEILNSFTPNQ